jgi:sulfite dehydrogenase (cytochrome) subunit B
MKAVSVLQALALICAEGYTQGTHALDVQLPQETAAFQPGAGVEIANAQCMICHSADFVAIQPPRLSAAQWTAEVRKMQKLGAPIPEEQIAPLVDYLTHTYRTQQRITPQ